MNKSQRHEMLVNEMVLMENFFSHMGLPSIMKDLALLHKIPEQSMIESLLFVAQKTGKHFWEVALAAYSV